METVGRESAEKAALEAVGRPESNLDKTDAFEYRIVERMHEKLTAYPTVHDSLTS